MSPTVPSQPLPRSVTTFLLGNLHCPSCVASIKDALQKEEGITWVSPNMITSCVAVEHDPAVPIMYMANKLESAGFQVSSVYASDRVSSSEDSEDRIREDTVPAGFWSKLSSRFTRSQLSARANQDEERAQAHLRNCEQCKAGRAHSNVTASEACAIPSPSTSNPKLASATIPFTNSSSTVTDTATKLQAWRASFAVSGMTCAACANTITVELEQKSWVTKCVVNLVTHSAVVEYTGEQAQAEDVLVDEIEGMGYGADLNEVVLVDDEKEVTQERTVQIRIDGFYCPHCSDRVLKSLVGFQQDIRIDFRPTIQRPILKLTYNPSAPKFTIRHILAAIEASDPALKASIYRPPSLEEQSKKLHTQHQRRVLFRVILTFILAIPTFVVGIVYMDLLPGTNPGTKFLTAPWVSGINRGQIAMLVFATPVWLFAGDLFHRRMFMEIWSLWKPTSQTPILRRFYRFGSMNMLISLGTSIAYIASVAQLIAAGVTKPVVIDNNNFYFDSVVFLTLFLLAGRYLEAYSKSKTGNAVEALGLLKPTSALLVESTADNKTSDRLVDTELLEYGDTVRVPRGASPPCDGDILVGETTVDESSLTGESRPIKKGPGDPVYSGTVNQGAPITISVTGTAGQSMLDQIIKVVREGQTKRAPMEKVADMLVSYFVPVITLIAILDWIIWLAIGYTHPSISSQPAVFSLQFAIAVFVIACPCGLALAAPTAIFVAGGLAAKYGILVKGGGEAVETASRIDCMVFDKTGTLTMGGEPSVTDSEYYLEEDSSQEKQGQLWAVLQSVEENSSHPIAKAIVNFCKKMTSDAVAVQDVEEVPGKGLKAIFSAGSGEKQTGVLVGNEALMREYSVDIPSKITTSLQIWKEEAKSVALIATSLDTDPAKYQIAAALSISDPIRPETPIVIKTLISRGVDVWMLSGDNMTTAKAVALKIGIPDTNVIAEVLPAEKFEKIKYLQSVLKARRGNNKEDTARRATVAMVGDGINDAPALSTADVGIAIGSGSDVAISSADFVLVNSNLASVVTLLDLSRKVFSRIKFNFGWALVYNLIGIPIAAGVFYPIVAAGNHVVLNPVWSSLAMALSSFSVVMSSLALKTRIPGLGFRAKRIGEGK
ncbi:heavy metal translocating P-type ATPase [Xylariaceae sp. FL0255]|nr:heavy metal translocating P-type ATPase [Xylariaceae sp. FL0255]